MAQSVRIRSIYLRNFKGIEVGLNKKELEVNFKKFNDKNIILILGDNATGKSTFMSVLHCLPGTTDGRQKFIIEDKEGIKKVVYDRSDGCRFECKIIYSPSKTGHNTKGFVTKISPNGDETELNENGNITSYKDVVQEELGISDSVLKLASQNDVCKGHVDMTSTERKVNMSTFLPDDLYSDYYAIADKIYKELKMRINVLVESLGKLHDDDTLRLELEKVTKKINDLVTKRDKCMAKISECQTRIDVIRENGIEDRAKKLKKEIGSCYETIGNVQKKIEDLYASFSLNSVLTRDSTLDRIKAVSEELSAQAKEKEIAARMTISKISDLKMKRNSLSSSIVEKETSIERLETGHSLSELEKMYVSYKNTASELRKKIKHIDPGVTKDTYMIGYEIVKTIRDFIAELGYYDNDLIQSVCEGSFRDFKLDEILAEMSSLEAEKTTITGKIKSLEIDESKESVLEKRPENCTIDTCPFIATAYKLKKIQDKIPEYMGRIDEIDKRLDSLRDKMEKANGYDEIKKKISSLMSYINSSMTIINRLPNHEKYSTIEALNNTILKGGTNLSDCDDFDEYIEALEDREDLKEFEEKKIPQIEHEIELLKTKGMFISSTKSDLEKLKKEKESINEELEKYESSLEETNSTIDYIRGVIEALGSFYDKKTEYDNIYDQIINDDKELKEISAQLEEIQMYAEKMAERKERLREIDDELNPLTRQREVYKMEQLKIASFKDELASVQDDIFKCEVVRAALSVKDNGIPVSALEWFMDTVRQTANSLLSQAFNGSLYLDEFVINSKDFIIPYHKNGDYGIDVSYSSSSERSFISLCLTMAIIEEIINKYSVVCLDEVDRGFSNATKSKFIEILAAAIRRAGIEQLFLITHNHNYYQGYDCGFILFPGADINETNENNIIRIERS